MKFYGMPFSPEMIRAIRNGKIMTRRVPSPMNCDFNGQGRSRITFGRVDWDNTFFQKGADGSKGKLLVFNPTLEAHEKVYPVWEKGDLIWVREGLYRSLSYARYFVDTRGSAVRWRWQQDRLPSIHMPKTACRMILKITDVRGQYLQDINEPDAKAEGFESVMEFRALWDRLNSKRGWGWEANRPVWVIEFEPLKGKQLKKALKGLISGRAS